MRRIAALAILAASCDAAAPPAAPPPPGAAPAPVPAAVPDPAVATEPEPGVIAGRVIYRGPLPASTSMYVPEAGDLDAHTLHVDRRTGGLRDAVLSIEGRPGTPRGGARKSHRVDQSGFAFQPHVLAVEEGDVVRFTNSDNANHNVHASSPGNDFNCGTPPGREGEHAFRLDPRRAPVKLRCDVHPWMLGWVHVFEHPWFAVSGRDGTFRIEGVPAGKHALKVHHADSGLDAVVQVEVEAGREAVVEAVLVGR